MSAQEKAEKIYFFFDFKLNYCEAAISLLWEEAYNREYWELVWECLLDKYGERWQQIEFEHQRIDYIKACQL
jgi:hypothetical protein